VNRMSSGVTVGGTLVSDTGAAGTPACALLHMSTGTSVTTKSVTSEVMTSGELVSRDSAKKLGDRDDMTHLQILFLTR